MPMRTQNCKHTREVEVRTMLSYLLPYMIGVICIGAVIWLIGRG